MIRADFPQDTESVTTENNTQQACAGVDNGACKDHINRGIIMHWLIIYASSMVMILLRPVTSASARLWGIIFSHWVNLKLGHRFHALSKVCSDRDDTVPFEHHK